MEGCCKLCRKESKLEKSHFIPKFIGKWSKNTSITGYFRQPSAPSRRMQDLHKEYWLCGNCEDIFSVWEREFANKVFYPIVDKGKDTVLYGRWMAKFAASLSWRTLTYVRHQSKIDNHSENYLKTIEAAQNGLASFLLGQDDNLYSFEQHVYQVGTVKSDGGLDLPANINRYMLRTIAMDIIGNDEMILTYTKLPSFIFVGVIKSKHSKDMRSSRISLSGGIVSPRTYVFPPGFYDYLVTSAQKISDTYDSIPLEHLKKINQFVLDNPDKAKNSKLFEAIKHDVDMFGNDAFQ
ncbi:hypothetical protein [Vibrio sp. TBV020]|uniref:hypothetical protein n=1 Tax=Vibrio sp. TBV020 TaxID=3137398 RepID=UPI0038CD8E20